MKLIFFADGEPAPGGSKSAYALTDKAGKLIIKTNASGRERPVLMWSDDSKGNKKWRQLVAWRGKSAMQHAKLPLFSGRIRLTIEFLMTRGKTVTRPHHTIAPDLSKLIRSTEDAMTGIVWVDDCLITDHGPMKKRYVRPGEQPGAHIMVEALEEETELELPLSAAPPPATARLGLATVASELGDSPFD